jgi:hypothetical protein
LAGASRKNIQMTEKWRAEKCLPRFVADAAPRGAGLIPPGEHCFDDTKLYFSVLHFSVIAFVQTNFTG